VAPHLFGDFYPLTSYSTANNVWMAFQFDCPEQGVGVVQAFRRAESPCEAIRVKLRGLVLQRLLK
jgi:alpha-galactosidase